MEKAMLLQYYQQQYQKQRDYKRLYMLAFVISVFLHIGF